MRSLRRMIATLLLVICSPSTARPNEQLADFFQVDRPFRRWYPEVQQNVFAAAVGDSSRSSGSWSKEGDDYDYSSKAKWPSVVLDDPAVMEGQPCDHVEVATSQRRPLPSDRLSGGEMYPCQESPLPSHVDDPEKTTEFMESPEFPAIIRESPEFPYSTSTSTAASKRKQSTQSPTLGPGSKKTPKEASTKSPGFAESSEFTESPEFPYTPEFTGRPLSTKRPRASSTHSPEIADSPELPPQDGPTSNRRPSASPTRSTTMASPPKTKTTSRGGRRIPPTTYRLACAGYTISCESKPRIDSGSPATCTVVEGLLDNNEEEEDDASQYNINFSVLRLEQEDKDYDDSRVHFIDKDNEKTNDVDRSQRLSLASERLIQTDSQGGNTYFQQPDSIQFRCEAGRVDCQRARDTWQGEAFYSCTFSSPERSRSRVLYNSGGSRRRWQYY